MDFLFGLEGESLTYKTVTRSYNTRGDDTESIATSTITAIIITSPDPRTSLFSFADVSDESIIIYTQTLIYEGDKITWKSSDWRINTVKIVDNEDGTRVLYAGLCSKERD